MLAKARAKIASAKVVCSTVPEIAGNRDLAGVSAPGDLADVDFAVVRAAFAVAETGSVLLSDADLRINALAYLAQHLIVLLDPVDIVSNLHHAYRRPEFRDRHYACFHSGPSATADIEGVLIHGAQGVARSPCCRSREQPETRPNEAEGAHTWSRPPRLSPTIPCGALRCWTTPFGTKARRSLRKSVAVWT